MLRMLCPLPRALGEPALRFPLETRKGNKVVALYHVHSHVLSKGATVGGAGGFAAYIHREMGAEHARYLYREDWHTQGREDLVEKGERGLPLWAKSAPHFFALAETYSRTNATVARCFEVALPRELSKPARLQVAATIRAVYFDQFPMAWAVHNPIDSQGQEHPHMHLMLSEKRVTDGVERDPQTYFSRAAAPGQDPATHGVRVDTSFQGIDRLQELRAGVAVILNAALEREGHDVAVSHLSLAAREVDREPAVYRRRSERQATLVARDSLHFFAHPWEQERALADWREQKVREGIHDLSRDAIVDRLRDKYFAHDMSPSRVQEREQSFYRALDREFARAAPEQTPSLVQEHHPRERHRGRALTGVSRGLDEMQHGAQVRLEREQDLGWER